MAALFFSYMPKCMWHICHFSIPRYNIGKHILLGKIIDFNLCIDSLNRNNQNNQINVNNKREEIKSITTIYIKGCATCNWACMKQIELP